MEKNPFFLPESELLDKIKKAAQEILVSYELAKNLKLTEEETNYLLVCLSRDVARKDPCFRKEKQAPLIVQRFKSILTLPEYRQIFPLPQKELSQLSNLSNLLTCYLFEIAKPQKHSFEARQAHISDLIARHWNR